MVWKLKYTKNNILCVEYSSVIPTFLLVAVYFEYLCTEKFIISNKMGLQTMWQNIKYSAFTKDFMLTCCRTILKKT